MGKIHVTQLDMDEHCGRTYRVTRFRGSPVYGANAIDSVGLVVWGNPINVNLDFEVCSMDNVVMQCYIPEKAFIEMMRLYRNAKKNDVAFREIL